MNLRWKSLCGRKSWDMEQAPLSADTAGPEESGQKTEILN